VEEHFHVERVGRKLMASKKEKQKRNAYRFMLFVAAWEYKGEPFRCRFLHKETKLEFNDIELKTKEVIK